MTHKILVAEDEMIIAHDLCDTVLEAGYEVDGPHARMSGALTACKDEKPDLAILDIELNDGEVYPLAQKLAAQNVPIIFHSGCHTSAEVEARFPGATTLSKPCPPAEMLQALNKVFEAA